ncbi:hypothetical protein QJS10_CPB11g00388 [Acorus calamus]|uniref:Uncharacterized protein n=1 Tax=Acorus calamus TaxID=4465 RepID=A0AAV9DX00_ACOCL|nr:hypothetical protein QJS10_CPB11g00388 [Acorus calamus]
MGFSDCPFLVGPPCGAFPSHDEIMSFIKGFIRDFRRRLRLFVHLPLGSVRHKSKRGLIPRLVVLDSV